MEKVKIIYKSLLLKLLKPSCFISFIKYSSVIFFLTCLLLYFTFPYNLLKEIALEKINSRLNSYNLNVSAASLKPSYLNGFTFENVSVDYFNHTVPESIVLNNVNVYVSFSNIFTGFLKFNIQLEKTKDENFNISLKVPLSSPFNGSFKIGALSISSKSFDIGEMLRLAYFSVSKKELDPTLTAFVNPAIERAKLQIYLSGHIDIYSSSNILNIIDGLNMDLIIEKGLFRSKNSETQKLVRSPFYLSYKNKILAIDKKTTLNTNDFSLNIFGNINFPKSINDFQNSILDLNLKYKNQGSPQPLIELMTTFLRCPKTSTHEKVKTINYSLKGQYGSLICQ